MITREIMREITVVDSKRRILLPKDIVENYGSKFVLVRFPDEILLRPLPKDPLKALCEEGRKLKGVTLKQFKKEVEEAFREDV